MSSEKTIWNKPSVTAFESAEDAIAYYLRNGMPEHAEAVKAALSKAELERRRRQEEHELFDVRRRKVSGR